MLAQKRGTKREFGEPDLCFSKKRTLFSDPPARKAQSQPRGGKKANAPTLPFAIEGIFTLFVAPFLGFFK
ncbi:hypothetical protein QNI22_14925 [Cytophagaceae bacterium BD1B2-1]|uniref:Uncharacterized protein n=1 Tax=Xanthocytophaga agilis TaxID=3048010 RepID=A0AAE3UDK9_9BACT|nr:hypothetical protein [Xanthocytophaga agilis]